MKLGDSSTLESVKTQQELEKIMKSTECKEITSRLNYDDFYPCSECGHCCKGSFEHLPVANYEIKRMAHYLKITEKAFKKKYTSKISKDYKISKYTVGNTRELKMPCAFYKNNKCSIYEVRPFTCWQFPFTAFAKSVKIMESYKCPLATAILEGFLEFADVNIPPLKSLSCTVDDVVHVSIGAHYFSRYLDSIYDEVADSEKPIFNSLERENYIIAVITPDDFSFNRKANFKEMNEFCFVVLSRDNKLIDTVVDLSKIVYDELESNNDERIIDRLVSEYTQHQCDEELFEADVCCFMSLLLTVNPKFHMCRFVSSIGNLDTGDVGLFNGFYCGTRDFSKEERDIRVAKVLGIKYDGITTLQDFRGKKK